MLDAGSSEHLNEKRAACEMLKGSTDVAPTPYACLMAKPAIWKQQSEPQAFLHQTSAKTG